MSQRFRDLPPKFGINKWKCNGREPLKLDKQYVPFKETYPIRIRNWVLGKDVKRSGEDVTIELLLSQILCSCLQKQHVFLRC